MSILFALFCLVAAATAGPVKDPFIINGEQANHGQFPWMAKISGCSASVVGRRTIITAAHCVCRSKPATVKVGVINSESEAGDEYRIDSVTLHPSYPTGSGCAVVRNYDLAVLKTTSDIAFNNNVQPISVEFSLQPNVGSPIISMGYGGDGQGGSNVLNFAKTTLTSSGCSTGYFCSSRSPNSIYFGDSGGPLVYVKNGQYVQIGVNSGISSSTSLYANIPRYADWMKTALA